MPLDPRAEAQLNARGLLPTSVRPVVLPAARHDIDRASKGRGALLGGAIGDALGRPLEGMTATEIAQSFGLVTGYELDPHGNIDASITDDTQMTLCVAESLIEHGHLDPDDLAARFVDLLPTIRGIGASTMQALLAMRKRVPWWDAAVDSAGNGAVMRVAPVGLRNATDLDALVRDAALSAVVTHANGMAVAGAIAQAFAVAYLVNTAPGSLDLRAFISTTTHVVEASLPNMPDEADRLLERLTALVDRLEGHSADVLVEIGTSGYVLESLPAAWWCFLRSPDDPEAVLLTAVNAGGDTDTVAAMAGTLTGAYLGDTGLPVGWVVDLENRDVLAHAADRLRSSS